MAQTFILTKSRIKTHTGRSVIVWHVTNHQGRLWDVFGYKRDALAYIARAEAGKAYKRPISGE